MPKAAKHPTPEVRPAHRPVHASRRHLLAGIGAAAIVSTAAVGIPAGRHPDAELLALLAEFDALELKIHPPGVRFDTIEEEDAHDAAIEPLRDQQKQVLTAIWAARATTLDGFRARARSLISWDHDMRETIATGDAPGYDDDQMVFALIRDLVAGGAA